MLIECPACHRTYRVEETVLLGQRAPLLKCSFDGRVFTPPADIRTDGCAADPPEDALSAAALDRGGVAPPPQTVSPHAEHRTAVSVRPVIAFLALLVVSYAALSSYLGAEPSRTQYFLNHLASFSPSQRARAPSRSQIRLVNVRGWYEQAGGGKQVFIISGQAMNLTPARAGAVRVEGKIFSGDGREVGRKVIYCGNGVSLGIVRNLSTSEISLLQGVVPPPHFAVAPQDSADFLIIFTNPPAHIKEFTCRVAATRFEREKT